MSYHVQVSCNDCEETLPLICQKGRFRGYGPISLDMRRRLVRDAGWVETNIGEIIHGCPRCDARNKQRNYQRQRTGRLGPDPEWLQDIATRAKAKLLLLEAKIGEAETLRSDVFSMEACCNFLVSSDDRARIEDVDRRMKQLEARTDHIEEVVGCKAACPYCDSTEPMENLGGWIGCPVCGGVSR